MPLKAERPPTLNPSTAVAQAGRALGSPQSSPSPQAGPALASDQAAQGFLQAGPEPPRMEPAQPCWAMAALSASPERAKGFPSTLLGLCGDPLTPLNILRQQAPSSKTALT